MISSGVNNDTKYCGYSGTGGCFYYDYDYSATTAGMDCYNCYYYQPRHIMYYVGRQSDGVDGYIYLLLKRRKHFEILKALAKDGRKKVIFRSVFKRNIKSKIKRISKYRKRVKLHWRKR